MTSNSNSYAYYSFPPTPSRSSPASRRSSKKPSTQSPTSPDATMAPSPAAGKQASNAPKTPTKLDRKPGATPKKLQSASRNASGNAPSTPKAASSKKPDTDSPSLPPRPDATDKAQDTADSTQDQAQDSKDQAEDAAEPAQTEMKDSDDEGPMNKVSADKPEEDLKDAAPEPVQDDEDAVGGATEHAQETAEEAGDEADNIPDDTTEKAGEMGESAAEDTTDDQEPAQEGEGEGEGLLKGAKGLADKAGDLAGRTEGATDAAKDATKDAKDSKDVKGAKEDVAGENTDEAGDAAEDAEEEAGEPVEGAEKAAEGATEEEGEPEAEEEEEESGEPVEGVEEAAEGITEEEGAPKAAEGAVDNAEETKEGAEDEVDGEEGVEGAKKDVEGEVDETAEHPKEGAEGELEEGAEGVEGAAKEHEEGEEGAEPKEDEEGVEGAEVEPKEGEEGVEGAEPKEGEEGVEGAELKEGEEGVEGAEAEPKEGEEGVEGAEKEGEGEEEEGAAGMEMPEGLPIDLSVMKGLEVNEDGQVYDAEGNAVGKLAEGDAEDLAGYPIGDNGEILDDDGDLVGRVELLPEEIKKQLQAAKEEGVEMPEGADEYLEHLDDAEKGEGEVEDEEEEEEEGPALPELSILEGLKCQVDGLIYDDDGNTVGMVMEGDPEELQNAVLNDKGEFIDEEGNVVGRAKIHEDAAALVEEGVYAAAEKPEGDEELADGEEAEGVAGEEGAEEGAEEGMEEPLEGIEDQLPGIEALEGHEINEAGEIVDDQGDVLAHITDEDLKQKIEDGEIDPATLKIDEEGNVVDEEGNVLATPELAEGAAEKLAGGQFLDLRILDGKRVNKKGKILNEDGEELGELRDGELSDCAGKTCNDKGEVLDKKGKVIGHVNVIPGEAAEAATKELVEELGEAEEAEEEAPQEVPAPDLPDLSILDGLKVNKKGQILDEDGEVIGELVDGELSECAGKKVNDQGEILNKEGNVVGHVRTTPPPGTEEEEQVNGEEEQEEEGEQLPPLSVLEGLTVNKAGKLIDSNGTVVGELIEGDAKKISKLGLQSDAEGQFWDNKGHVIGRAQTVAVEDPDEESPFAGLEGLHVVDDGFVEDDQGNKDGDIIDKKGSVVGHAERYEPEVEEEVAPEEVDLSFLQGKTLNKAGFVIGDEGVPVARLVEGNPKDLAGKQLDGQGQIWNDQGQVIGRVELIPQEERGAKPEGPFAGLEGLRVIEGGKVADEDGNVVGEITEGNAKRLIGLAVDEDGDIVDKYGNVKGHAEPLPEEEEEAPVDNSVLSGKVLNKQGYVVDENGMPFGRLVEGDAKELAGRVCDENGDLHNDQGKVVGHCEVIPEGERGYRGEGPFAGLEGLRVVNEGFVEDEAGNVVGQLVEGNPKRLVGMAVDEDGDIIDKYGNVKGHAEPYEAPDEEVEVVDLSALAGTTINKNGNAVDGNGKIIGKVAEGDVQSMIGNKVDGQGQIWDSAGNVVGRCELSYGDTKEEGPFAGFEGLQIQKDGTVTTAAGDIVGRVIEGDIKKLMGHTVDEDGDIVDRNGNSLGKAERWEPEEKERIANAMSGMRVNREGEVRDQNGDLVGRLTMGDLGHCVGQEIDDAGNVVDIDGNKIGEVTLLENIADDYEGPTEEELAEAAKREEEREIAEKMSAICTQTLERVQPVCKQIKDYMEKADRTPREELDEDELVDNVKPLIEEAGRHLQECNGSLRGLDPDGHIAAQAKGRAGTKEATPEEVRLSENLKELTTTVVTTVDDAKKKLNDMPQAKKKLNPLWGLMTQPLVQILAAVGLLLAGVLGLVGQLLNGLGLGGLTNGLLGGLGINKLMESFGLGGGKDKKKKGGKSALASVPLVGDTGRLAPSREPHSGRDDRRRDRDGDGGGGGDRRDTRRRSRSPGHRGGGRREYPEVDTYSSGRDYRERDRGEREDRYGGGRGERRDRGERGDWDRGEQRRNARRDDDGGGDDRRRDRRGGRDLMDDRRRPREEQGGREKPEDRGRDRDDMRQLERQARQKSGSPPAKKEREPTPDLTDVVSVLERKRRLTQWDIKPPGYENVTAEQAKLSGMFPLPGAPRAQPMDPSKLQAFMNQPGNQAAKTALKPSTARQSKRLFVFNLPASATDNSVNDFFNLQLNGLNVTKGQDPCISAQVSQDRSFALLEFKTAEDATNGMALDGINMEPEAMDTSNGTSNGSAQGLKIQRPKDYIVPAITDETESETGVLSNIVPDTQNKISITHIPVYLAEEQVQELLVSFGELKSFVLVTDTASGQNRGIAFCEYIDAAGATDIAVESLNGMELGDSMLKVQRASIGIQQVGGEMSVNVMSLMAGTTSKDMEAGRVLCLMNMITPEELMDAEEADEILMDVKEECAKYGALLDVKMPRPNSGSRSGNGIGKIYIKYEKAESAQKALAALAGRKFADRTVVATFYGEEYFDVGAW
ncbi:hypothetical protein LTR74_002323 [Friedmanniomyces endolithicus]|nr:hypothetical protein LTR74_002323 [Friedmanniomyces endolithicus]